MSSTRKSKNGSVFHQARYASSAEFERGLVAYLVAKRCALIADEVDRDLIWFIHYLSHQEGGLAVVAKELIAKYAAQLQPPVMAELGIKPGKICNADQVKKIRASLPEDFAQRFLLKGEIAHFIYGITSVKDLADDEIENNYPDRALKNPTSYPASEFTELFQSKAGSNLENYLREICLNPEIKLNSDPWWFPSLTSALREYKDHFVKAKSAGVVTTALGKKVCEVLEYTSFCRGLTLIQGEARLGKSFAARGYCDQHPGRARFVEVPPSNDEASFFRALARGLGIGNFLQYKVSEIRERVESVLRAGDLLLVLDEAHRLWPQRNLRYGFPSRINWVMAMANHNVPICAIATPQFIQCQKAAEEKGQWNSSQLTGRISHYESLPSDLSPEDLMAVAKSVLPEANAQVLRVLAVYARSSARYLAAIDSISKRARYIAMLDSRDVATTEDVRMAMQESVIPADTKLQRALESGRKGRLGKLTLAPAEPELPATSSSVRESAPEEVLPARARGSLGLPGSRAPAGHEASLIEA